MRISNEFDESEDPRRPSPAGRDPVAESRPERLARIKAEIASGEYDTAERFDAALERMFESLELS